MLRCAQAILASSNRTGAIQWIFVERREGRSTNVRRHNLKGRTTSMQHEKGSAAPGLFHDSAKLGPQLFGIDALDGCFHVQLKINLFEGSRQSP